MLIRISLILAIIAALGAGGLGYYEVTTQIPALVQQRDQENKLKHDALTELDTTKKTLAKTKTQLAQTQQELADAQAQRDKAVATASEQTKRANDLSDKLTQASQDRDDARNQLAAYTTTGLTPEQVAKLTRTLKDSQNAIEALNIEEGKLLHTISRLTNELATLVNPDVDIKLRADLRGKIVVVDPKWQFVVLNVGEDQGIIKDGELLVSREGKLVAKVIVRSVEKDRCIANLMPGWTFGEVLEGDQVSPAHPAPAS
jgi:hypothetical protein